MSNSTAPRLLKRKLQMTVVESSEVRDVVVFVGIPEPDPAPGGDFRVLVEIEGFEEPYSRHVHGVDEIQAFLEGCSLVSQILPALAPAGARLTWLGDEDLGFGTREPAKE